ncbi:hypothetical protein [Nocardia africana]
MVAVSSINAALRRLRGDTPLEWLQYGNSRDTAATHITGKTRDRTRVGAQLSHAEQSTVATVHYIDRNGYIQDAVDNADVMESLKPAKVGAKLESGRVA